MKVKIDPDQAHDDKMQKHLDDAGEFLKLVDGKYTCSNGEQYDCHQEALQREYDLRRAA